jgi:D-alanyl-D-alanine carboxypeptidase
MRRLAALTAEVGVPGDYAERTGLAPVPEPAFLTYVHPDRYGRPLWLELRSARAWKAMVAAAKADGLLLEAISGYRSWDYQAAILHRKLAAGQSLAQIMAVNTAPGFSEHHSGRAIDIGAPGEPPAQESFEKTPHFAWLGERAAEFGFRMSYPRGNAHGVIYEPWHWCWQAPAARLPAASEVD